MKRLTLALCLLASPALSQQQCGGAVDMLAHLSANFGEAPRVRALTADGVLFVITASPAGGWTALAIGADGSACILAAGEGFEVEAPGEDS